MLWISLQLSQHAFDVLSQQPLKKKWTQIINRHHVLVHDYCNRLTTHSRNSCTMAHCIAGMKCHKIRTFPHCNWCIRLPVYWTFSNNNCIFVAVSCRSPTDSSGCPQYSRLHRCPSNRCYCEIVPFYLVWHCLRRHHFELCCWHFWITILWFCLRIREKVASGSTFCLWLLSRVKLTVNFFHFVGIILIDNLLIDKIFILICENAFVWLLTGPFATFRTDWHIFRGKRLKSIKL